MNQPDLSELGPLHRVDRSESTNTELRRMLNEGAPLGTLLWAREQTAGRGSRGRSWCSREGASLTLSLALPPVEPLVLATLLGAVATWRSAQRLGVEGARIKWPNDVLVGPRKLAGVLAELGGPKDRPSVVLGIGLNVALDPADLPSELHDQVCSIAEWAPGADVDQVGDALIDELRRGWAPLSIGNSTTLREQFLDGLGLRSKWVELRVAGRSRTARLRGLEASGRLRLEDAGGEHFLVESAHVDRLRATAPPGPQPLEPGAG